MARDWFQGDPGLRRRGMRNLRRILLSPAAPDAPTPPTSSRVASGELRVTVMCSKSCGILSSTSTSVRLSTLSGPLRRDHSCTSCACLPVASYAATRFTNHSLARATAPSRVNE